MIKRVVSHPDTNPLAFTYPIKPQLSTAFSVGVSVGHPTKHKTGAGYVNGVQNGERGGYLLVPLWDHCCYRNTKCEIQSEAKAELYIGRPQTPWEPYMLCVGVFKYL